jgi:Ca2+-binding EF-hand superfamily protein
LSQKPEPNRLLQTVRQTLQRAARSYSGVHRVPVRALFDSIDSEHDGIITASQLVHAIEGLGGSLTVTDAKAVIAAAVTAVTGTDGASHSGMQYTDFAALLADDGECILLQHRTSY